MGNLYFDTRTDTLIFENTRNYFNPRHIMTVYFHYEIDGTKYVLERRIRRRGYIPFKDRELSEYTIDSPLL